MSRRGFTLYELMISLVLIGVLSGLAATLTAAVREDDRRAAGYVADLQHLRAASDLLTARVRAARQVELVAGALCVDGRRYEVVDGTLLCDGAPAVRGVSRLDVARSETGAWTIEVAPVPRRAGAHAPALVATARPRAEAGR